MVEIDYYSKYLKYKQKYLKQKNLQIGGENIYINIYIDEYIEPITMDPRTNDFKKNPRIKFLSQIFVKENKIKTDILNWFKKYEITSKVEFTVKKISESNYCDSEKTFEEEKIKSYDTIIVFLGSK